ncbi:hypothetical Protein YC6258_01601 [Gynuella sunshinyii YC6258]|uniref:Uncharacterized protein n=1 Tax=Gynuella sunshinyii YC6258 TaxID=1445510 RepID=A0A0C5VTK6_9GAMM|nr:hypothetical Protein YC6258_01601 [Gynuella sunshinyii YC6258]
MAGCGRQILHGRIELYFATDPTVNPINTRLFLSSILLL